MKKLAPVLLLLFLYFFNGQLLKATTYPHQNFKIAVMGDSAISDEFVEVLNLIKQEDVDLIVHTGDFSNDDGPAGHPWYNEYNTWGGRFNKVMGESFAIIGADGNHDDWDDYKPFFQDRLSKMGVNEVIDEKGNYTVDYGGVRFVIIEEPGRNYAYLQQKLSESDHLFKVCVWHHVVANFQTGLKGNESDFVSYDICRQHGAFVVNGHEHAYARTYTLNKIKENAHGVEGEANIITVQPQTSTQVGKNFMATVGIGGYRPREYKEANNGDYWWSTIYTTNRWCKYTCTLPNFSGQDFSRDMPSTKLYEGALFITFNPSDSSTPTLAQAYFKDTQNRIIDEFKIFAGKPIKKGDLNKDGEVNLVDVIFLVKKLFGG